MNWWVLTWIHIGLLTFYYLWTKKILSGVKIDPIVQGVFANLGVGLVMTPIALISGFHFQFNITTLVILTGVVLAYTAAVSLYYPGLQKTAISKTMVLEFTGAIWSLLYGMTLLGERITVKKLLGLALILGSVVLVSQIKKGIKINKYELMILGAAACYTLGGTFDKKLSSYTTPLSYLAISFLAAGIFMAVIYFRRVTKSGLEMLKNKNYVRNLSLLIINTSVAYLALFSAYKSGGEISAIYPLLQTTGVITAILGIWLFKETEGLYRKLVALGLVLGAGLVMR